MGTTPAVEKGPSCIAVSDCHRCSCHRGACAQGRTKLLRTSVVSKANMGSVDYGEVDILLGNPLRVKKLIEEGKVKLDQVRHSTASPTLAARDAPPPKMSDISWGFRGVHLSALIFIVIPSIPSPLHTFSLRLGCEGVGSLSIFSKLMTACRRHGSAARPDSVMRY